jgi:hypothetical protein
LKDQVAGNPSHCVSSTSRVDHSSYRHKLCLSHRSSLPHFQPHRTIRYHSEIVGSLSHHGPAVKSWPVGVPAAKSLRISNFKITEETSQVVLSRTPVVVRAEPRIQHIHPNRNSFLRAFSRGHLELRMLSAPTGWRLKFQIFLQP